MERLTIQRDLNNVNVGVIDHLVPISQIGPFLLQKMLYTPLPFHGWQLRSPMETLLIKTLKFGLQMVSIFEIRSIS